MPSTRASDPTTLSRRLRRTARTAGFICLVLCVAAVAVLARIERSVQRVAEEIVDDAIPASELVQSVNTLAFKVAEYSRTRTELDHKAALTEFDATIAAFARKRAFTAHNNERLNSALALTREWHENFAELAKYTLGSDRSTRGLAAQCSLLTTLTLFRSTQDLGLESSNLPLHFPLSGVILAGVGEIQNCILLASSLLDPSQLDRALIQQQKLTASIAQTLAKSPDSETRTSLVEISESMRDIGDELENLQMSLLRRNSAQEKSIAAENRTLTFLTPVAAQVMQDTLSIASHTSQQLRTTVAVLAAAALLLPLAGYFSSRRFAESVTRQLAPLVRRLSTVAAETAKETSGAEADARSLSSAAAEQADALGKINLNTVGLTATAGANVERTFSAEQLAASANAKAVTGEAGMSELNTAMIDLAAANQRIQETVIAIDEISFHINLLAVNAAIEAARAGEAGRGFAVVADEVRNLALRSTAAAHETADVLRDTHATTSRGIHAAARVVQNFQEITEDVGKIRSFISQTSHSSHQQAEEVQSITAALRQLSAVTENTSTQSKRSARFSTIIQQHSADLARDAAELEQFLRMSNSSGSKSTQGTLKRLFGRPKRNSSGPEYN